jgi:hypothetical protein
MQTGVIAVIRQTITCDICGAEKQQTNHWFVAFFQGAELRITAWTANSRSRAGSKHLCGQTCLHKLVDDCIAGFAASRSQPSEPDPIEIEGMFESTDVSLTSSAAHASTPRPVEPVAVRASTAPPLPIVPAAVVAIATSHPVEEARVVIAVPPVNDAPSYGSRHWRAEAWERERERERRTGVAGRRKSS